VSTKAGNPFDPPARQLKPAIQFLRLLDVPATRIAYALGETADNIRHLDTRASEDDSEILLPASIEDLAVQYQTMSQEKPSGARGRLMGSIKERRRMEALEDEVTRIREEHGTADLVSGFRQLRTLLPYVSNVSQPHALRVRAALEEQIGWFAGHLGLASTAYQHAKSAMEYRRTCYGSSFGNRGHLLAYASSGLIAANSLLISRRPKEAMNTLALIYEAKSAAAETPGSEWYRQLATALLQYGSNDSLAYKLYDKAGFEMEREAALPVMSRMNRERQQNLLLPHLGWEKALDLIADAKTAFGEFSLQHVMVMNWAAAVGLHLDSPSAIQHCQELLQGMAKRNLPFAHQGTVTKLLSITPDLKLNPELTDIWIRFALYQNAARNK
jgi:hypothetical protein